MSQLAAIAYPASLPAPQTASYTPAERRALSEIAGKRNARPLSADRLAQQQLTWVLNDAQVAVWLAWGLTDLFEWGAWFAAAWSQPAGGIGVRRFVGSPSYPEFLPGFGWRVQATVQLRGRGELPYLFDGFTCASVLTDAFTDTDETALTAHTPDLFPAGVTWHNGGGGSPMSISSNRAISTSSGGFGSAFNVAETAIGLVLPYRVTFSATNTDHGGNGTHIRMDGPDLGAGTTSRIDIEIVPLGGPTDSVHVHVIANFNTTGDETEYALAVSNDVEHTIAVLFEAHQFTVAVDGAFAATVPMVATCPSDAAYIIIATSDDTSTVDLVDICQPDALAPGG